MQLIKPWVTLGLILVLAAGGLRGQDRQPEQASRPLEEGSLQQDRPAQPEDPAERGYAHTRVVKIPDLAFHPDVFCGLDILEQMDFRPLQGKSIAVLCNQAAVNRNGQHLLTLLKDYPTISVKILFLPQYGLFASEDERLKILGPEGFDPIHGARLVDLFGRYVKPPRWSLREMDLVLVDLQDTGVRYSTYMTTITKTLEAASDLDVPVILLDRPNPLRGDRVDGPVVRTAYQSFEGYHLVPIRHGLTVGEYALMVNEMGWIKDLRRADLTIVPLANWKREQWRDEFNPPWIPPAPELGDLETCLAFTGMALLRGTNLNAGEGTDKPYLRAGAPWLAPDLAKKLNRLELPGVRIVSLRYQPQLTPGLVPAPRYAGEECSGIELEITDRESFDPLATATAIIILASRLYPREFEWIGPDYIARLFGSNQLQVFAAQNKPAEYLPPLWTRDVLRFIQFRQRFLLYP